MKELAKITYNGETVSMNLRTIGFGYIVKTENIDGSKSVVADTEQEAIATLERLAAEMVGMKGADHNGNKPNSTL